MNVKHDGIITWHTGLKQGTATVNGINIEINIHKKYPLENVIALADALFEWSEAIYGYISLSSLCTETLEQCGIQQGISGLMRVNYFGKPFVKEPEFHVIEEMEHVHHGVRLKLTETPDYIRLKDAHYIKSLKEKIGEGWFWNPLTRRTRLIPEFDRSEMISQED